MANPVGPRTNEAGRSATKEPVPEKDQPVASQRRPAAPELADDEEQAPDTIPAPPWLGDD
jgi:hypothetical protein